MGQPIATWLSPLAGDALCAWVGEMTFDQAMARCERADWMLVMACRTGVEYARLVRAACDCARTALRFARSAEPRRAIDAAEAWSRGQASISDVTSAHDAVRWARRNLRRSQVGDHVILAYEAASAAAFAAISRPEDWTSVVQAAALAASALASEAEETAQFAGPAGAAAMAAANLECCRLIRAALVRA